MLAVAFPGLGQIYNRKYWKIPIVYAGFGALIYAISFNSSEFNIFLKAYVDYTDNIPETNSYIKVIKNVDPATYDPVTQPNNYGWYKDRMLRQVDYFKKYRDLSYIGIGAWYLFTVVDANVDASLFNFNVRDDLKMKLEPGIRPVAGRNDMGVFLCFKLTF